MSDKVHPNRLAQETSPYLLQHAHNPVDWYSWGPEAFEAAQKQNKPIFLSVGYSTCYWCHVMERQCFEVESIAHEMNQRFINIKVDREERPDVDSLYMTAVQVMTRQGGWPMSVFLTPDLRPFYGGTYFPPTDAQGRPGFVTVLRAMDEAWRNRHDEVERTAAQLAAILQKVGKPAAAQQRVVIDADLIDRIVADSTADYDPQHGGFGGAPKFPRETLLEFLLDHQGRHPNTTLLNQLTHTLDAMAFGGIRDQLGGGFHRYSTDAQWLVPHFEIMLYDNAMLALIYLQAYRQTENIRYAHIARGIFDFVLGEMTSPEGAFYTAFDAEVDGHEGLNYLWHPDEVRDILGDASTVGGPFPPDDIDLLLKVYGLDQGPNFGDPHHGNGMPDSNILFLAEPTLAEANLDRLAPLKTALLAARRKRKQPSLDTKIITGWNGLMIRALAKGGDMLHEPRYLEAARRGARFLMVNHRTPTGVLLRTSRNGQAKYDGFLDDYAFFAQALLALHKADGDDEWKEAAATIATDLLQKFGDDVDGGFFFTAKGASELPVRQKVAGDSPLPSGNAVAAVVMLELGHSELAKNTIAAFAGQIKEIGQGMSSLVLAAARYVDQEGELIVEPDSVNPTTASPVPAADSGIVNLSARWQSPEILMVAVSIADGYHIQADRPDPGLVATHLTVQGADVAAVEYPVPRMEKFPFADKPAAVFSQRFEITVRLKAAPAGPIRLLLKYQACTDQACLAPVTQSLDISP
jgi:uncharacterized protein YyaL (SSP411 family)